MSCIVCGAETHRDDADNIRCNGCERTVGYCRCTPSAEKAPRPKREMRGCEDE